MAATVWLVFLGVLAAVLVLAAAVLGILCLRTASARRRERNTLKQMAAAFARTVDNKDMFTRGHAQRTADCAVKIGRKMRFPDLDGLYYAALLHDIGKVGIPVSLLQKLDRLTVDERRLVESHPKKGAAILKEITGIPHIADGALYHHEQYDGTGYPDGKAGEEIPLVARIICVANAYDAMSNDRAYREALSREEMVGELMRGSGTRYDPDVVNAMIKVLAEEAG